MRIVSSICRFGAALAELLLLRARRKPARDAATAETEARAAVARHDEDAVNAAIEDGRLRRTARRSGFCVLEIIVAIFILALCFAFGCVRTRTLVIPADRRVIYVDEGDLHGWLVPDATMADLVGEHVSSSILEQNKGE